MYKFIRGMRRNKIQWRKLLPSALVAAVLLILAVGLPAAAAKYPDLVERVYAQGIYPVLLKMLQFLFSFLPFSFAEFVVILLITGCVIWLFFLFRNLFRKQWFIVIKKFLRACTVILSIFLSFYLLWGFNYFRPSIITKWGLEPKLYTQEALQELCDTLVQQAAYSRSLLPETEKQTADMGSCKSIFDSVPHIYITLQEKYAFTNIKASKPKPVLLLSRLMSASHITGIYFPFTGEANVNIAPPPLYLPFYSSHEVAHQLGVAREDEANFTAYIAGINSHDIRFRYAADMMALAYAGNALARIDYNAYRTMRTSYSEGMSRDLQELHDFWQSYENTVWERIATNMNDRYLKAQGQKAGVQSYGHMVDWLLAAYEKGMITVQP